VGEEQQRKTDSTSLIIYCLGSFRVYLDDQLITDWSSGKGKSIFKYMILNRDRTIAKEVLMELFWPETDPESARNNLNVAVYALRQAFRAIRPDFSCLLFQDDHYLLNPTLTLWADFEQFNRYYQQGRRLEQQGQLAEAIREYELAESLYEGDFMEEDLYEDWSILQRESLKDNYLIILERLSRYYLEQQRYTTCVHLCQKILAKDDCREDAHRRLMRCYYQRGQPHLALRQYHRCVEALAQVLDVSPTPETVTLYERIRNREAV
jgi:DNA-binding SARP family transcriptional activator